MELGLYFKNLEDYEEAILWFINASSETTAIIDTRANGNKPLFEIAECYRLASKKAKLANDTYLSDIYMSNSLEYEQQAKQWTMPEELL